MNTYVKVIIPIPIPQLYTYGVPETLLKEVEVGKRVIVEFGRRKLYSAVIAEINTSEPTHYVAKPILEVIDAQPLLNHFQLQLIQWVSSYYMCAPGEVINAAMPSGLKLSSDSMIQVHPSFDANGYLPEDIDPSEAVIMEHLLTGVAVKLHELSAITSLKSPHRFVQSLIRREYVILYEEISEKYQPKTARYVRIHSDFATEQALEALLQQLEKKPLQSNVILSYLRQVPVLETPSSNNEGMAKKTLIDAGNSASSVQTLLKNGVLEEFDQEVSRFPKITEIKAPASLSPVQQTAYNAIMTAFEGDQPVVLHGITGSGKTEIYVQLIQQALLQGQQVLYLLPEIALSQQIVERLMGLFGDALGVYHSRFSDAERVEAWNNIQTGRFKVIVGVRSAVFLPFHDLGLIIVDEEHDHSYKQKEPAPRYHARDVALMLAQWHHAQIVLGSATPSVENYYHALSGKYALVQLKERYNDAQLPEIKLIDLKEEQRKNTLKGIFSGVLLQEIEQALARKEQVILFQNRRGYSPTIRCETCLWIPKCTRCDISLTLHQYKHEINCHYCGYKEKSPHACPACGNTHITPVGFGTEKVEEEIKLYFPDATVDRMDMETTRSRKNLDTILQHVEQGQTQILVGTQMVTKGLDFDNVTLVGILNADNMIHFPDFRSSERALQNMLQVSGRAGRKNKPGKVIVQTYTPQHPLFLQVKNHAYEAFYASEIVERERLGYVPFFRLIHITVKHKEAAKGMEAATELTHALTTAIGHQRVLGPSIPSISRIRNFYHFDILIKLERDKIKLPEIKSIVQDRIDYLLSVARFTSARVVVNVDPL